MSIPIGIVGFSGYSGAEALRLLAHHPHCSPILLAHRQDSGDHAPLLRKSLIHRAPATAEAVKAEGIIVYTVQVNTGNDPVSTLLQNCASDPSKFFYMTDANALVGTFEQIGKELSDLRLAW